MSILHRRLLFTLLLISSLSMSKSASANHLEAQMYVVTDWIAECPANDLAYWDDMVDFWYDEIDNHGWYHKDRRWVDGNIHRDLFCDPDTGLANCEDHNYLDEGDAVMLGMHGSDSGNHWRGALRRDGGSAVNDCRIDAPESWAGSEIRAGDVDLEFLHLSSCNSMDDDNLQHAFYMFGDADDTPNNGRRLHQANGFHGFMWIGGCCDDQYEDFAEDAHAVSVKESWMDNMYVTGINGSATQCPVAYAVGKDRDACFDRIDNERYNNVYSDPSDLGYYCYYYYDDCDPSGESAFSDPNG